MADPAQDMSKVVDFQLHSRQLADVPRNTLNPHFPSKALISLS